jgi:hypothetical protein
MKADRRTQLEQVLQTARQLVSEYEQKIALEPDPKRKDTLQAEHKKTQQRIQEFEELLSAYSPVVANTSISPVEQPPQAPSTEYEQAGAAPLQTVTLEQASVAPERLALPHWFIDEMLPLLLDDLIPDQREQRLLLDALQSSRQVEILPGSQRYRVLERQRTTILKSWQESDKLKEFMRRSASLAQYCAEQVAATSGTQQDQWRSEQLYHLAVAEPEQAMQLMKTWFDESIETNFDLNQAYCWLLQLDERYTLLAELEKTCTPPAAWTAELARLHEYLAARAFWTEEWYRTINYQERDTLKRQLEGFFNASGAGIPWLLNLYAEGGYGKTTTIQWLLSRYLPPQGFVCAHFDYSSLSPNEQLEVFQQPQKVLNLLSKNLNAQRSSKIEALVRQSELHSDPVGRFTLVLRETYGDKPVVLFIDTFETVRQNEPKPGQALVKLLRMFIQIREGDIPYGGSTPGYTNLRVVLSGRRKLSDFYQQELHESFREELGNEAALLPLVEVEVPGFTSEEAQRYLTQKRKLTNLTQEQITAMLEKAKVSGNTGSATVPTTNEANIIPLKLAQYADLLQETPALDAADILAIEDIDAAYLANRILKHIQNPAIHWLLRYGVIFRRLDMEAAQQVLMPFLQQALEGQKDLDDPDLDPPMIRAALAISRQQAGKRIEETRQLFDQLTRYSWVERHGDCITIHPEVSTPQLKIIAKQKIFKELQHAAFEHYKRYIDNSPDQHQQANALREAVYHVLQIDDKEAADQWQQLFACYRNGPGPMLWTLIDETFLQNSSPLRSSFLPDIDRFYAFVDLANVLLTEKEQPFLPYQLERAEDCAKYASNIADKLKVSGFSAHLVRARVELARYKLSAALETARACTREATTSEQQAQALVVLGEAEAANSRWESALDTLRRAYHIIKQAVLQSEWLPAGITAAIKVVDRRVQLNFIEQLLNSPRWHDALPLLQEAQRVYPRDPAVLTIAARLAFKQARLEEALAYYQQAIAINREQGNRTRIEKLLVEQQRVLLYQGNIFPGTANDTSVLAVTTAAMRADWLAIESLLDAQLVKASDVETLGVINTLLQYYLEVMGDWRQIESLLERGARWFSKLSDADADPNVARYKVLQQYIDFLKSPPVLQTEAAMQEYKSRLDQIVALPTPEARVRAKGYLLLVRFYGALGAERVHKNEREAVKIYTRCAVEALDRTFDLLLQLAPIDQVDVMRTLAALPGWSSWLINDVALDPTERSPLLLLRKSVTRVAASPFLAQLAKTGHLQLETRLADLRQQILDSRSDWPLLYTSFARLLAALGQYKEARHFLHEAPFKREAQKPYIRVLIAQDQAFIASWKAARQGIAEAIAYLEHLPAEARGNLIEELRLIRAYLSLDKGTTQEQWSMVYDELASTDSDNTCLSQDFLLLKAVSCIKLGYLSQADMALKEAAEVALNLGNIYATAIIRTVQSHLETSVPQPGQGLELAERVEVSSPTPPTEKSRGLELILKPVNDDTIEVTLATLQQQPRSFKTQTQLQRIKQLLPQGSLLTTLPDLDYWHKLLNADSNQGHSLEKIGTTLLDDLLPIGSQGRTLLSRSFQQANQSLHFSIQGTRLEGLPWSILHDTQTNSWLYEHFRCSYNYPPQEPLTLYGGAVAIVSTTTLRESDSSTLSQLKKLYTKTPLSAWFYGHELLGQGGPSESTKTAPVLKQVKLVHLVSDLSELDDIEGIFLNMGTLKTPDEFERLTPDHLARRLRQLHITSSLIVLEPLSTGLNVEDARVLLLRNRYAAALARLGSWTVLATGPRHSTTTTNLLEQLLNTDPLTIEILENIVQIARKQTSAFSFDSFLEGQFEIFYPALM